MPLPSKTADSPQMGDSVHRLVVPLDLWLQWHGDGDPDDDGQVCESEVTWCREKIFDHDVEYVRADRVSILLQALTGLTMPCTRADYTASRLDAVVCDIAQTAIDEYRHNADVEPPSQRDEN